MMKLACRTSYALTRMTAVLLAFLALTLASDSSYAQARPAGSTKARGAPVAAAEQFALTNPPVAPGETSDARYPAAGMQDSVPAHVVHGERPGPLIAYVFHGFSSEEAFFAEMKAVFGKLNPKQMQGTVLAISLPSRVPCDPECTSTEEQVWQKLAPSLVQDARFMVQIHQHDAASALSPHAFVYKPEANPRLANYVESMAKAALIGNLVELGESDPSPDALEHLSPRSIALEHPAINVEVATLEANSSAQASQLRRGLLNVLHHLKMAPGAVSWQGATKLVPFSAIRQAILGD